MNDGVALTSVVHPDNSELDENDPIIKAIDRGGGQCCDVAGVLRELDLAGFEIVMKGPTDNHDFGDAVVTEEIELPADEMWPDGTGSGPEGWMRVGS